MSRPDVGHAFFPQAQRLIILCFRAKNTDILSWTAGTEPEPEPWKRWKVPGRRGRLSGPDTKKSSSLTECYVCFFVFMCACKCEWKPAWPSETLINGACITIRSFVFHVFVISPLVRRSQDISHWSKRARRDLFLCQQIIMLIKSCQKMKNHAKKSQATVLTLVKTK